MSEKIEPALTAEEWAGLKRSEFRADFHALLNSPFSMPGTIAALNDLLPDSDARKITRAWVAAIRTQYEAAIADNAGAESWGWVQELRSIADAFESYLPPESA